MGIPETRKILNQQHLRIIALISMALDHVYKNILEPFGYVAETSPFAQVFIIGGRLAFPLFSFFIAEGFVKTSNKKRYLLRMIAWAVVTEPFFDQMLFGQWVNWKYQNILFTFSLALVMLYAVEWIMDLLSSQGLSETTSQLLGLPFVIGIALLAEALMVDYGGLVVMLVYFFYFFEREQYGWIVIIGAFTFTSYNLPGLLSVGLLTLYNGERGKQYKWLNYSFYPLHMIMIVLIRYAIEMMYFLNEWV